MEPTLALLSMTVLPFLYYSVSYYVKHIESRLLKVRGMEGESLSIIHEAVSMMRVIVAFGREDHEYRRFRGQGERAIVARVNLTVRQTVFSLVVDAITAIGTALALGVGAYYVLDGRLSVGRLMVVMAYIAGVYKPLETISTTVGSLQDMFMRRCGCPSTCSTSSLRSLMPRGAIAIERAKGAITFDRISFNYQTRVDTLKNISFEITAGQTVAIVGPTGAGKTTLTSLIPRFYDAQEGRILLDGTDIKSLALKSSSQRRSASSCRNPSCFRVRLPRISVHGSAWRRTWTRSSKRLAAGQCTARVHSAATESVPDRSLGERGRRLSGGERQRIAVGRSLFSRMHRS